MEKNGYFWSCTGYPTCKNTFSNENGKPALKEKRNGEVINLKCAGPNTFDCSGFVQYVFIKSTGITLPRASSDQASYKPRISLMNMKKGDLIFFETTGKGRISHVGIYMGNKQFIHASSGGKRVMVSSLDTSYYMKSFRWGVDPLQ